MADEQITQDVLDFTLIELVTQALQKPSLSELQSVLRHLAQRMTADGCILWKLGPIAGKHQTPQMHRLLVSSFWSANLSPLDVSEVSVQSVIGNSIETKEARSYTVSEQPTLFASDEYLREHSIRSLLVVPITFPDKLQTKGAITVSRELASPFDEQRKHILEKFAPLVAELYYVIKRRALFELIRKVDDSTTDASTEVKATNDAINPVVQNVCQLVSESLNCVETTVFLEDPADELDIFQLRGTTWPDLSTIRTKQNRSNRTRLTSYALQHSGPFFIADLTKFDRDRDKILQHYPSLDWTYSTRISNLARQHLNVDVGERTPPLSFIAMPIVALNNKLLGIIRCCYARTPPYYLGIEELELLERVAKHLADYWTKILKQRDADNENISWKTLIDSMRSFNRLVHEQLSNLATNNQQVLDQASEIAAQFIKSANTSDIRLFNPDRTILRYAARYGEAWKGSADEIQARWERVTTWADVPQDSALMEAFNSRRSVVIQNTRAGAYHPNLKTFPEATRLVTTPICAGDAIYGFLNIRDEVVHDFPDYVGTVAEVLGQQLGQYLFIAETLTKVRESQLTLHNNLDSQRKSYEDLVHQLRSPLIYGAVRIQQVLKALPIDSALIRPIQAIRGLNLKARRVATNTGVFALLLGDKPLILKQDKIDIDTLVKKLFESAVDNEFLMDSERNITFNLNRRSFESLRVASIPGDLTLIEQAINNILDNAFKYSFPNTRVEIYGGLTGTGRLHITVENVGIPLRAEDITQCTKREWRGEDAQLVTGEGSGIGLWVVDNIMRSHHGNLLIQPTTQTDLTQVKLVFPI